jgi:hypothetical protein
MTMDVLPCRGEPQSELVIIGDAGGLVHMHKLVPHSGGDALQVCTRGQCPSTEVACCTLSRDYTLDTRMSIHCIATAASWEAMHGVRARVRYTLVQALAIRPFRCA